MLGFRCDVDEICALLGYYTALSGNPLLTFWDNVSVPSSRVKKSMQKVHEEKDFFLEFLTYEDWTDTLSQNCGTGLLLNAA
jgi:hypothetical protein